VIYFRNWCFDVGLFHSTHVGVPVISVGNITVGGTGKTPFVEFLLREVIGKERVVAVVSRGYGRSTHGTQVVSDGVSMHGTAQTSGDEPHQIAQKFPQVIVIVDEDRVRGATHAIMNHKAEVIILDDGFQHRSIARDLDIVMIDGIEPLNTQLLLPAGRRREHLSSLKRAHAMAISGLSGNEKYLDSLPSAPIVRVQSVPKYFRRVSNGAIHSLSDFKGKVCVTFCGIARPEQFKNMMQDIGLSVTDSISYSDHYQYTVADLQLIKKQIESGKTDMLVTTEKDAVRLQAPELMNIVSTLPLYYLEIETRVVQGEEKLRTLVHRAIDRAA
jgi:tetraacyldisaccharide 4'-kinase